MIGSLVNRLKKVRRLLYASRLLIPGLREQHIAEAMVGPLGVWDVCRSYQIKSLRKLGLKPKHYLADIGCGPLQGGVAFIKYLDVGRYVGIDINAEKLSAGYRQIGINGLSGKNPRLIVSETFGAKELDAMVFDYFWVSQILYHFTKKHLSDLCIMVRKHSHEKSVLYGDIIGPEHREHTTGEHDMILHTIESLQEIVGPLGFDVEEAGRIADYGYPTRLALHTNILIRMTRTG